MKYTITSAGWKATVEGESPLDAAGKAVRTSRPKELGRIVKAKPECGRPTYLSTAVVVERSGLKYAQ